jgi:putative SOS response-associated peptidase YedK
MCYSAMIWADYRKFVRRFGATLSIKEFAALYLRDPGKERKRDRTPKAMDASFGSPGSPAERAIHEAIVQADAEDTASLEQELFKQVRRLADAGRALQLKTTKKAQEDQRIAGNKIAQLKGRIADLKRIDLKPDDSRIYPGTFAPVLVMENGRRVIKPMRYQCRVEGAPAVFDRKYPGTYNARRDSLGGYWRKQFAHTHAVMVASAFYEHVDRDGANTILEFKPGDASDMLVACLWSRWTDPDGEELLSFAAITDEPPPEVAAAGHDRCIIPIKPEHLDAWLDPLGDVAAMQAILDDRERPYFEHRMAA